MSDKIPIFLLTCVKTDYPNHLVKGCRYKIDLAKKDKQNEIPTYWYHPMENKWVIIGNFPLRCFDTELVRKWLNEKKGIVEKSVVRERSMVRERIYQPITRERV